MRISFLASCFLFHSVVPLLCSPLSIVHVPTLEQVILFCRDRKLKLMIETKEYVDHHLLRSKIVALYDKYDMYSWSFVATFNPWSVRRQIGIWTSWAPAGQVLLCSARTVRGNC